MDVRAVRRSVISQRCDLESTNSYSILPALGRIGILNDTTPGVFHRRPTETPVFAFGSPGSGLSSLAMALSMLGYRCCSDLEDLPAAEMSALLAGRREAVFNAYVNIASLSGHADLLRRIYPCARIIVMGDIETREHSLLAQFVSEGALHLSDAGSWLAICQYLRLAPPLDAYPRVPEVGQRALADVDPCRPGATFSRKQLMHDHSPWIVPRDVMSIGIGIKPCLPRRLAHITRSRFIDQLQDLDPARWMLREDTFPGNLGLFRPANVTTSSGQGAVLAVRREALGVRDLSAAAISTQSRFLFGRFEATLQPANVPGLVTGFFLHRDSPRQEIDIEITGDRPDRLLVNVFYNPGAEGAKYDYGYRGTPVSIDLGFDASQSAHSFAIEWEPDEIRWFVDGRLVHRRMLWGPTPIPHLPMTLHVNVWPTRSTELAGQLHLLRLPAIARIKGISVDAITAGQDCFGHLRLSRPSTLEEITPAQV
ncbi:family 16 glycosylhydrolase [Stenotrophomonas sp. P5_B8]